MFFGSSSRDVGRLGRPLDKVAIPQADEQQRLLANLITRMNADRLPLPRFWYLPRGEKAAVVMTGDDHASSNPNGTPANSTRSGREPARLLGRRLGVRARHLVRVPRRRSRDEGLQGAGFEFGLHLATRLRQR